MRLTGGRALLAAIRAPVVIEGRTMQIGASIGIVAADGGCLSAEELLRRADQAMYQAKAQGGPRRVQRGRCLIACRRDPPIAPHSTRPELMAPAGDWDCARAAVENGADAVYFGLRGGFNARRGRRTSTWRNCPSCSPSCTSAA